MNKSKVAVTIINCVTAIVCCVAISIAGFSIVKKICENEQTIAQAVADGSINNPSESGGIHTDNFISGGSEADSQAGDISDGADDNSMQTDDSETVITDDTVAKDKVITVTSGLSSIDKAEILKYYQLVMAKNQKDGLGHNLNLTLVKLDGGSGGIGGLISMFEPVAKSALKDNSTPNEGLPGVPEQVRVSDIASATAVNDGRYTTVTMNIVEQTDGPYGRVNEGPVGRTIGVLDGVALAIEKINGLKADFQNGSLALHYKNPKVVIKVDNKTGSLVKGSCSWGYQVHVEIKELAVEMSVFSLTLRGTSGIVELKSTY